MTTESVDLGLQTRASGSGQCRWPQEMKATPDLVLETEALSSTQSPWPHIRPSNEDAFVFISRWELTPWTWQSSESKLPA